MVIRGRSTRSVVTSNVPNGDRHIPASVRSFPERFGGSYKTCMRCACAHLGWSGPTVAIGGHVLEGQNGNVSRWSRTANKARGKAISIKYQLLGHV